MESDTVRTNAIRRACIWILSRKWFVYLSTAAILLNTLVLSMEYDGMSEIYQLTLEWINSIPALYFVVEMVIKMVGLGVKVYFNEAFNTFDAIVNTISIVEIVVLSSGSLSALRTFRILRILKLARTWKSLRMFINTMLKTLAELGNFSIIVCLLVLIYSLMGMQIFGGRFVFEDGEIPRSNFDSLLWSAVTVFQAGCHARRDEKRWKSLGALLRVACCDWQLCRRESVHRHPPQFLCSASH